MGIFDSVIKYVNKGSDKPKEILRPIATMQPMQVTNGKYEVPTWPFSYLFLWNIAQNSDVTRLTISNIRNEVFRRGFELENAFESKCTNNDCGREYPYSLDKCEICDSQTRTPSKDQASRWNKFFYIKCNKLGGGENFLDVLNALEEDLNICDNAYAMFVKNYAYDEHGYIKAAFITEFQRVHPANIRLLRNKYGETGFEYTCPIHRTKAFPEKGKCKEQDCNLRLYPVEFAAVDSNGGISGNPTLYYIEGEVKHLVRYTPTSDYGYPPLFSIWQKVLTDLKIDTYMFDAYAKQRNPNQMLLFHTSNAEALEKAIMNWNTRTKLNPHAITPIAIPRLQGGEKDEPTLIDFNNNLPDFEAVRNSLRTAIAAFYGVSPIMMGDTSTGSGLHNESLQITVSNRRVETNQATYHNKLFPWMLEVMGVTDFKIKLLPSEEKDEMADLQRDQLKIQNAQTMKNMGFKVEIKQGDELEFKYSKAPETVAVSQSELLPLSTPDDPRQSGSPDKVFGDYRKSDDVQKSFASVQSNKLEDEFDGIIKKEFASLKGQTKAQLKKAAKSASLQLSIKAKDLTEERLKDFYKQQLTSLAKRSLELTAQSENNLNSVFGSNIFTQAYAGLDENISKRLNEVIDARFSAPGELSLQDLIADMKTQATELANNQLETIARTEVHNVALLAREEAYDKLNPDAKVKWLNPVDNRTTPICKNIVVRTKNGVSLEELRKIIKEEADPKTYRADRPYSPHINCRSVWA